MRIKYQRRTIKDRIATDDNVYILENIEDGKTKLIHTPSFVAEQGTKLNAELLSHVDEFLETLTNEEGHLVDRNDQVAVIGDVTEVINKTQEVTEKLNVRINETNRDLTSLNKKVDSIADGVLSLAILQVRSRDVNLTSSKEIVPNWSIIRVSNPKLLNLVDNKLGVYQEGLVTFNTTVEINEPRESDTILTLNLIHNGIINQRDILIPQGDEHIIRSLHLEFINLNDHETKLVLESNKPLTIDNIESLISFNFIGEMNTANITLTDSHLEAGVNSGMTNQFDLNRQTHDNINDLKTNVMANQVWAETEINQLKNTRPANGYDANFNNLSVNSLVVAGNISANNLLETPFRQTHSFPINSIFEEFTFGNEPNNPLPGGVRVFYLVFRDNVGNQEHFALIPNFRSNTTFPSRICEMRVNNVTTASFNRRIFNVDNMIYDFHDTNGTFRVGVRLTGSWQQTSWNARNSNNVHDITCELIAI